MRGWRGVTYNYRAKRFEAIQREPLSNNGVCISMGLAMVIFGVILLIVLL